MDTVKRALKMEGEGTQEENLHTFLQMYRTTPNPNSPQNKSPGEVFFGRPIRTSLDLLRKPSKQKNIKNEKMEQQFNQHHGAKKVQFNVDDSVYAKVFKNNSWSWQINKVIERRGKVPYVVLLESGRHIRLHANQLKSNNTPNNSNSMFQKLSLELLAEQSPTTEPVLPPISIDSNSESQSPIADLPILRRGSRIRRPCKRFSSSEFN